MGLRKAGQIIGTPFCEATESTDSLSESLFSISGKRSDIDILSLVNRQTVYEVAEPTLEMLKGLLFNIYVSDPPNIPFSEVSILSLKSSSLMLVT